MNADVDFGLDMDLAVADTEMPVDFLLDEWSRECVSDLLAELVTQVPSHVVATGLSMVDPGRLSPDDAVTYLHVVQRMQAWLAALEATALVAAADPQPRIDEYEVWDLTPEGEEYRQVLIPDAIREEIACALRWSTFVARDRIDTARWLAGPLRATWLALAGGTITASHVRVVVDAALRLPGAGESDETARAAFAVACDQLQTRVLPVAARGTLSATRQAAKRAVALIDAEGEERRRQSSRRCSDVSVIDELDGMSTLIAYLATEKAHAVMALIDAAAHAANPAAPTDSGVHWPGDGVDDRSVGERRADALADLILRGGRGSDGASALSVSLDVNVDLSTLLGLADSPVRIGADADVAMDALRDLLADADVAATIRRFATDPITGHLLDYGRSTYAIPARLRDFIVARDRTCRFPGCRRQAKNCQIDHATAWNDGGSTSVENLGAVCTRHHQLKTFAGWDISDSKADGTCTWTSPQGRVYDHDPPPF